MEGTREVGSGFSIERDGERLRRLAEQSVYLGTSSWNYPGWIGQVYNGAQLFKKDGSINKAAFEREQLAQYSQAFPTVCFDGQYYRFPDVRQLQKFASQVHDGFKMAVKVTQDITVRQWEVTQGPRRRGERNPAYLDATLYEQDFHRPLLEGLADKLGPIIFEFSAFKFNEWGGQADYQPIDFVKDLHRFLDRIPKDGLEIGVEVRDPVLIDPNFGRYLDCLEYHGVAHVLNEQTRMPEIHEQLELPGIHTASHTIVRGLVRPGVSHADAVDEFEPYDRTQLELPGMRQALASLIGESISTRRAAYMYINNRTEGNSPNTIAAVLDLFEQE